MARRRLATIAAREERARLQAEAASRMKDEFLHTLSHELRTPLTAILGWSKMLSTNSIPEQQRAKAVQTIERNASVQVRLIDDLLDVSRIISGKLVLSVEPLELVKVVEAALDTVRPTANAKNVRLQPVLDSHATIMGDAERLQQVVWNLLMNAIKFTPKGGRVHVRLRRDHSYVELSVADTGKGIEPELLPYIFERFHQGDSSITRRFGGLGLGLSIVRSIVELHGGLVEARSDGSGFGAIFLVRLPMATLRADKEPIDSDAEARDRKTSSLHAPEGLKGLRVLVVDDDADSRALVSFLLGHCGAQVSEASSKATALAALDASAFDVLVSDIGMPSEDGYSLMRSVRARSRDAGGAIPSLALTAYAHSEDRTAALRAGFDMHIGKPIDPSEFLAAVEAVCLRRR